MAKSSEPADKPSFWWVYTVYESPITKPYYVKVGITNRPLVRLQELQQGNPRRLRVPDYERKPNGEFGLRLDSKKEARELERRVHSHLEEMGARIISDFDYSSMSAFKREWFEGIHPEEVWLIVVKEYNKMTY